MTPPQTRPNTLKKIRKLAFFTFVFGLTALPQISFAAEELPTIESDTVVVTATRTAQLLQDVSATMQVFTKEDIQAIGATSVTDVLRTVQGVQLGKKLGLRGMPSEGTTILVNGRRPAGELKMGTGANRTTDRIDINRIERIEVLSGPSSALYGSTTGGVINIITKKSSEPSLTAGMEGGNYQLRNYYSIDSGKIGNFDFLADISLAKNNPVNDWRIDDPDTGFGEYDISAKGTEFYGSIAVGYDFNDDHRLTLNADYFGEEYLTGSVSNKKNMPSYSETFETAKRYSTSLIYDGVAGDHMYSIGFSYGALEEILDYADSTNIYQTYTADFQDTWAINEQHLITFGGEIKSETAYVKESGIDSEETSFALYIQDEMRFFDETLIIVPAVRYDNFESWGSNWSPKLGVVWKFHEDHRLKGNFGLGFRAPQVDELYRNSLHNGDNPKESISGAGKTSYGYLGNPDLQPEKSTSWDIGYEGEHDNMSWGVTYFHNDIENLIGGWDWVDEPRGGYDGYFTFGQTESARTQGIEAKFGIDFLDYFSFGVNYTWLDARDTETGYFLDNMAEHTFRLKLDFVQPEWGTTASIWTETADTFYTNAERGDATAFTTVNASVRQKVGDNVTVFASATNIFNVLGNTSSYLDVDPMEWKAGLEVTF